MKESNKDKLVTFGIIPTSPETGFGYIQTCEEISENIKFSKIINFMEKPNIEVAKKLLKKKNYLWNSGIFLFKASTILKEIEKYQPEILQICEESINKGIKDLDFFRINQEIFRNCPNVPIDIAVMEKTTIGSVFPLQVGWSDIGSWKSVWENSKKDCKGNTIKGNVIIDNVNNSYLRSEERLVVGIDVNNLVVVETCDAILISKKILLRKLKPLYKN